MVSSGRLLGFQGSSVAKLSNRLVGCRSKDGSTQSHSLDVRFSGSFLATAPSEQPDVVGYRVGLRGVFWWAVH